MGLVEFIQISDDQCTQDMTSNSTLNFKWN